MDRENKVVIFMPDIHCEISIIIVYKYWSFQEFRRSRIRRIFTTTYTSESEGRSMAVHSTLSGQRSLDSTQLYHIQRR